MSINKIANGMRGLDIRNILNQLIDEVNNLTTLKPQPKFTLDAKTIANAMDNGVYNGAGSLKTLPQGWHVIPESNSLITGRPSGSQGDLIYFNQDVGKGSDYAYGFALGKDKQGVDSMWVQYRDGTSWTSWWPIRNLSQLSPTNLPSDIQATIADLKAADQDAISRLDKLETAIGRIYAPDQATFDRAVRGLITPELTPLEQQIQSNKVEIQALENTALTLDSVKAQLMAEGWGPLPGTPDKPLSNEAVEYYATYGVTFPLSIGKTLTSADNTVQLSRSGTDAARIFVIVKNNSGQAERVTGISIDDGLQALWDHRDYVISGTPYRVFYSPNAFYEVSNKVKVNYR